MMERFQEVLEQARQSAEIDHADDPVGMGYAMAGYLAQWVVSLEQRAALIALPISNHEDHEDHA